MDVRLWPRSAVAKTVAELRVDVRRLTAAVERLEAVQRKDAEQVKKLRRTVTESAQGWQRALDAAEGAAAESRRGLHRDHVARERLAERLSAGQRTESKWRKIFNNQLSTLVRHLCVPLDRLQPPHALNARRFRLKSQNEEDGILFALLERAGWGGCRFVEIGSGKSGGNAAALAHECGWAGLMIDMSERSVVRARKKFAANPLVTLLAEQITPDNVNAILTSHGYDGEVDILSIDVDSYDYWILEALTVTSPRILVLEYNALFGPERRVTIPRDQPVESTPKGYNGASLAAMASLAARKGYRLVTCENAGVNAFFLRADMATDVRAVSPAEAFKPLRSRVDINDAEIEADIYGAVEKRNLPLVEV